MYKYYELNKKTGNIEKKLYRAMNLKLADILLYKVCEGDIICYPAFTSACAREITPDYFDKIEIEKEDEKNNEKKKDKKKDDKKKKQEIEDSLYAMQLQDEDARLPSEIGQEIAYEGENVVDGDENVVEVVQKIVDCVDLIIENNDENNEYPSAINISALSDKKAEEERLFPAFSFFKIKKVEIRTGSKEKPHRIFLEVVNKKYNLEQRMYAGERVYLDSKTNLLMTRKFVNE